MIKNQAYIRLLPLFLVLLLVTGCGFHLRGAFQISPSLQVLQIQPNQPYDPFQRALRQILKSNQVTLVDDQNSNPKPTLLNIMNHSFSERVVAYGSDGQANRATLQLNVRYQILDPTGKINSQEKTVQVERELTINPSAVLATDNERTRLKADLYLDAAAQLVRQLSVIP